MRQKMFIRTKNTPELVSKYVNDKRVLSLHDEAYRMPIVNPKAVYATIKRCIKLPARQNADLVLNRFLESNKESNFFNSCRF